MSEEQDRLAELLRAAASDAERNAPVFDVDRIVATAHRRRPWLAFGTWLRTSSFPTAPAFAAVAVLVLVAVGAIIFGILHTSGPRRAIGSTTTIGPQTTTTAVGPSTTAVQPSTTTALPPTSTTTTLQQTTTTASSTTTTTATTTTTTTTVTTTTGVPFTYSVMWQGKVVAIQPAGNVDMANLPDAHLQGVATDFLTDDPKYAPLDGTSIDVWSAPSEFPGQLVVNNSRQASEPKGTWTFAG